MDLPYVYLSDRHFKKGQSRNTDKERMPNCQSVKEMKKTHSLMQYDM